jgi:hypothetical protein
LCKNEAAKLRGGEDDEEEEREKELPVAGYDVPHF